MKNKLVTKLKAKAQDIWHKATPVVKREAQKAISKSAGDIKDSIFFWVTAFGIIYGVSSVGCGKELFQAASSVPEAINIYHNEVYNVNFYYGEGKV